MADEVLPSPANQFTTQLNFDRPSVVFNLFYGIGSEVPLAHYGLNVGDFAQFIEFVACHDAAPS